VALDQHRIVIEDQGRDADQRIIGPDLVGIGENRPRFVIERQIIEGQGNADAADKG